MMNRYSRITDFIANHLPLLKMRLATNEQLRKGLNFIFTKSLISSSLLEAYTHKFNEFDKEINQLINCYEQLQKNYENIENIQEECTAIIKEMEEIRKEHEDSL